MATPPKSFINTPIPYEPITSYPYYITVWDHTNDSWIVKKCFSDGTTQDLEVFGFKEDADEFIRYEQGR